MEKEKKYKDKKRTKKSWYDAQAVRDDADPEAVVNALGLESRKKGDAIQFLCPFHSDRHIGNCSISQKRKVYHCFSCGASGDIIGLAQKLTGLSYPDTLAFVAESSGHDPKEYLQGGDEPEKVRKQKAFLAENKAMLSALGLKTTPGWFPQLVCIASTKEEAEAIAERDHLSIVKEETSFESGEYTYALTKRTKLPTIEEFAKEDPEAYRWMLEGKRQEFAANAINYRESINRYIGDPEVRSFFLSPVRERIKAINDAWPYKEN